LFFETAGNPQGGHGGRERAKAASQRFGLPKSKGRDGQDWSAMVTLEEVAREGNLREAFRRVKANKGAPGPDRQTIAMVEKHLEDLLPKLSRSLLEETYEPGMIRRKWLPKPGGGERGLGIPDVVDRTVGQALELVLGPLYEPTFHPNSHGFIRERSCHTAIAQAVQYLEEGNGIVVDLDLDKFFDRVNRQRLLDRMSQRVKDRRILRLIGKMLKAKVVLPDGVVVETVEGVPQGGPLSPLLSNIVLDELDWEMDRRGYRFVRYADDTNVYVASERAGKRVMASVTRFIEKRLRLKVNASKSAVAKPEDRHFLGFRLRRDPLEGDVEVLLSKRSTERIQKRIRELTPRNWGQSLRACLRGLKAYLNGWIGFFQIVTEAERRLLATLDAHIRRRLRAILLRQWKTKRTIARRLIRLGVSAKTVWRLLHTGRKSWWALSHAPAVDRGLRNAYFAERGLVSLAERWDELNPRFHAPQQLALPLG
jgi:RNA-directed DNA polymerase